MQYWQYAVLRAHCAHVVCNNTHRETAGMRDAVMAQVKRAAWEAAARGVTATDDSEAMSRVVRTRTLDQP